MRYLFFFFMVLTLWGGGHVYMGRRLIEASGLQGARQKAAWALLTSMAILTLLVLVLERAVGLSEALSPLLWAAYIYMGFIVLVLLGVLLRDLGLLLGRIGVRLVRLVQRERAKEAPGGQEVVHSRRAFLMGLTNAGIVGASGVMSAVGFAQARRAPALIEVDVPVKGLHPDLDGLRVAQVSDLHVGPTIRADFVRRVVEVTNAARPDLVAITGDLVDGLVADRRPDVAPLADLLAPLGVFYVTGNHEYYWGVHAWIEEVARLGFKPLINAHALVERGAGRLLVAGVTDYREGQRAGQPSDPGAALKGAPEAHARILLAHQPRSVFEAARQGFDLQLSGHTHGGQFVPWNFLVWLAQPFNAGLHLFEGMWIYVSRGTGYWGPPQRFGVPPEVTVLTLRAA